MNFKKAVSALNKIIDQHRPETFSSSWISKNSQPLYNYFRINFRTENNDVDWDIITQALDPSFQRKWVRYRKRYVKPYENQEEVACILSKYQAQLYVFIAPDSKKERDLRNRIIIALVRIAQKGNVLAKNEIIKWLTYVTEDWIDKYPQIYKWQGYPDEVEDKIVSCIRGYRYTGSFLGYLFKTLEYSARGKPPLYSLDDTFLNGAKRRIDFVTMEE